MERGTSLQNVQGLDIRTVAEIVTATGTAQDRAPAPQGVRLVTREGHLAHLGSREATPMTRSEVIDVDFFSHIKKHNQWQGSEDLFIICIYCFVC